MAATATRSVAKTVEGAVEIVDAVAAAGFGNIDRVEPERRGHRYAAVQRGAAAAGRRGLGVPDVRRDLNDVALAAITDSFRAALLRRGEEPRRDSLRTLVPVSVRPHDALDTADNRVAVMLPYLPVDKADRVEQLLAVHRRLSRAQAGGQRHAARAATTALELVPFAVSSRVVRHLTGLPQRGVVTLATNMPGSRQRLVLMGRQVVRLLPIPPVTPRMRTGVAIVSYGDDLAFGIAADFDAVPDADELAFGIKKALACLAAAARRPRTGRPALAMIHPSVAESL